MTEKPYASNDLSIGALRRRDWTGSVAAFLEVDRSVLSDRPILEAATGFAIEDLEERQRAIFGHPLGPIELQISDSHSDYFTRGRAVLLAERRVLHLLHPPTIFPELVPFPRALRLERRARYAVQSARIRLRRSWRALRGEEADPWT